MPERMRRALGSRGHGRRHPPFCLSCDHGPAPEGAARPSFRMLRRRPARNAELPRAAATAAPSIRNHEPPATPAGASHATQADMPERMRRAPRSRGHGRQHPPFCLSCDHRPAPESAPRPSFRMLRRFPARNAELPRAATTAAPSIRNHEPAATPAGASHATQADMPERMRRAPGSRGHGRQHPPFCLSCEHRPAPEGAARPSFRMLRRRPERNAELPRAATTAAPSIRNHEPPARDPDQRDRRLSARPGGSARRGR
jgi:7-keto-8-aminopelargonate synthetase-like enzyme